MIVAFKAYLLPYIIYMMVFGACLYATSRRSVASLYVYVVLVMFPQLWYPVHALPLGSTSLTFLVLAGFIGTWFRPPADPTRGSPATTIWLAIIYTYLGLWLTSLSYGLSLPISGRSPILADWKNYSMMMLLFFLAFRSLQDERDVKTLFTVMVVVVLLMSWREYRNFYPGSSFSYSRRAGETFNFVGLNANHFGAFMSNMAALCLGLFVVERDRRRRWLYIGTFICALYPLFYSYSRGAYVALLAAVVMIGLLKYRPLIFLMVLFGMFWQEILPSTVVDRMEMTETESGEIEESAAARLILWNFARDLFLGSPIFGIGHNGIYFATVDLPLRNAHNYFLTVAAEQGLIGLLLLGSIILRALSSGWKLYKSQSSHAMNGLGLGFVAYTISMVVTNMFGDRYSQLEMGSYFWILFGCVERARALASRPASAAQGDQVAAVAGAVDVPRQ